LNTRVMQTATRVALSSRSFFPKRSGLSFGSGIFQKQAVAVPRVFDTQTRSLNLHEYDSKALMDKYNVRTQRWRLASTPEEASKGAKDLNAKELVIKAQILAGGRGKGEFDTGFKGGVHLCKTAEEAADLAGKMLGHKLITKQTAAEGVLVNKVTVVEAIDIATEKYFAILMDRQYMGPVMVGSPRGGMDIEAVAEETPELIFKEAVDITKGVDPAATRRMAINLGFKGEEQIKEAQKQMSALYDLFIASDATQVEINPLAETPEGVVYCVDAKINFDDNASFRQKEIFAKHDPSEDDPRETAAAKYNLNYIGMDGNIGCMVNGAGLAMATMDIIKLYNGEPANFLDVGGGATENQVTQAFKILTSDPQVKAILVNIFGGIMQCDIIAAGIVGAAKQVNLEIPLVVRLEGTNVEIGKDILQKSGLPIIAANDLDDAAQKAVAAIN